jgi:hypothetical protein
MSGLLFIDRKTPVFGANNSADTQNNIIKNAKEGHLDSQIRTF